MCYIIASTENKGGYYVARRFIDRFTCTDFIAPFWREYDGRLTASQALTFDTVERAQAYLQGHYGLIPDTWFIREYDPCMNCVKEVANVPDLILFSIAFHGFSGMCKEK